MRKILFVFPTLWDKPQLEARRATWQDRFEIAYTEPTDDDCRWDFDVMAWITATAERYRGKVAGVTSSSDYPGAVAAAALAAELGLPGPRPEAVLAAAHKYRSRCMQRECVPDATARFELIDPDRPDRGPKEVGFPCFIKPVKGAFSVMTGCVDNQQQLVEFFGRDETHVYRTNVVDIFNRLLRQFTHETIDGRWFLAEEILRGNLVTVEGYVHQRTVHVLGIVDSEVHPETGSFTRFVYPSTLAAAVQARMHDITRRFVLPLGLEASFFNIEMMYDPETDRIAIIEINPRMCGQFADLYFKVDGWHTYDALLDLASGQAPRRPHRAGAYHVAASVPLRTYDPVTVLRTPTPDDLAAVEVIAPGTLVWVECNAGDELKDFVSGDDGRSYRYGVVNVGAHDLQSLHDTYKTVEARLGLQLGPIEH